VDPSAGLNAQAAAPNRIRYFVATDVELTSQTPFFPVDHYRLLYDYSYWARDRVLAQVAKLDQEAYVAPRGLDYESIRGTLVHCLAREIIWLDRWHGKADSLIGDSHLATFETLMERWTSEEARMRAFLDDLNDSRLSETVTYESALANKRYAIPLWHMMSHVVNHSTQHRSEVALALTQLGLSPGDLDLIVYLNPLPL
jgi:uncharacterized damage-inducible protein DinB